MLINLLVLLVLATCINPQGTSDQLNPDREKCIRCICNAVSACYELPECATKSINLNYWLEAGAPTVDSAENDNSVAYSKCIQNDGCVLSTMDKYTRKIIGRINDIDCDGIIDCRDYLAVHKHGMGAKDPGKTFTRAETKRFDICIGKEVGNLTDSGWTPRICVVERNNFVS